MNKIYNNLNVENLVKTDWFNQFDKKQQKQIRDGLEKGLDISWYANLGYNWEQMDEIRKGLEANLDVSVYAKKDFNSIQMG